MTEQLVTLFNVGNPTDPKNYHSNGRVSGLPLNWQDDVTGTMRAAVMAYLDQKPTDEQLKLVIAYIQHHIHAPCFLERSPWGEVDEETARAIKALRAKSMEMKTLKDVNHYINRALGVGLDPL